MNAADKIGLLPGFGWIAGHGFWVTLLICWGLTPFGMIIVGLVGESRLVPLTPSKQFLGFFPGDLFLGVTAALLLFVAAKYLPSEHYWYNSHWWHVVALVLALAIASFMTYGEWKNGAYPHRAILSPTKVYHNLLLYGGYGYVIMTTLVAVLCSGRSLWIALAVVFGLAWVGLNVVDSTNGTAPTKALHAHVADWQPFWEH